ncbi:MAG: SpoIIIAH-like family protein [Clostridia bacterium]|nr:SpoIIIAH-like family protein [Clostridia bacterium]
MSKKKKKLVVLSAMVLALGTALFLNWQLSDVGIAAKENDASEVKVIGEAELVNGTANGNFDEFFSAARMQRESSRASSLEILDAIAASADVDADAKTTAAEEAATIARRIESEANIESLIKAKGFAECVVMIGDDGVKVMVQSAGLLPAEAAQIAEIVTSETGEDLSRVRIVEVK